MPKYIISEDQTITIDGQTINLQKGDILHDNNIVIEELTPDQIMEVLAGGIIEQEPKPIDQREEPKDLEILDDNEPDKPDDEIEVPEQHIPEQKEPKYANYKALKIPKETKKPKTRQNIINKIKTNVIKPFIEKTTQIEVEQKVVDDIEALLGGREEWTDKDIQTYYQIFTPSSYIEGAPSESVLKDIVYPAIQENNNIIESYIIIQDDSERWKDFFGKSSPFKTIDPYALSKVDIKLWPNILRPRIQEMDLQNKWQEYLVVNLKIGLETKPQFTPFVEQQEGVKNYEKLLRYFRYTMIYFANSPIKSVKIDYLNFLKQYLEENSRSIIKKDQINNFLYIARDGNEYVLRDMREPEQGVVMVTTAPVKLQSPKSFGKIAKRRPMDDSTADTETQKLINAINGLFMSVGPDLIHDKETNQEKYQTLKESDRIDWDTIIKLETTFDQLFFIMDKMGKTGDKYQDLTQFDDIYLLALYRVIMDKLSDNSRMIPNKIEFEQTFNQEPTGRNIHIATNYGTGKKDKIMQIDVKPLWKAQYKWLNKMAKHLKGQPQPTPEIPDPDDITETIVTKPGKLMTENGEIELSVADKLIINNIKKLKLKQK